MYIYLLTQSENRGYDTFDSCVVCAKDEEEAKGIHPEEPWAKENEVKTSRWGNDYGSWASKPEKVQATLLGTAAPRSVRGVILASFNAG